MLDSVSPGEMSSWMIAAAVAVGLVWGPGNARAQEVLPLSGEVGSDQGDPELTASPEPDQEQPELRPRSPGLALAWSLVPTVVGVGGGIGLVALGLNQVSGADFDKTLVLVGGLIGYGSLAAGPAFGHFYAGQAGRGLAGATIRAAASVGAYVIGVMWVDQAWAYGTAQAAEDEGCSACANRIRLFTLFSAGFLAVATASAVVDIMAAPSSARQTNQERAAPKTSFSIAPLVLKDPRSKSTLRGAMIAMQF